ncbi:hypothetical protein [Martelella mangrovi]|uniref:PD-(D/E)XK nuclease superfamily protein n=1 Tax=Martelella mangrovi TaxID=1397477 RepID=A0ABV2IGG2_9HYPH
MLSENAYRDSVRERDLDNFLVEELSSSDDFRDWLLSRITAAFVPPETGDIRVRKSPVRASLDGRQTDVELGWFSGGDQQACVLLESKVTAEFQTGQAESYLGEVQAQLRKLGPKRAAAVLVAPAGKMASLQHNGAFAADVTIEEIITFLESRLVDIQEGELSRRLSVRIELLEALAGKRTSGGWVASPVAEKSNFAIAYEQLASKILPDVKVRPSTNGPQAITRIFDGMLIPALPNMKLRHEFGNQVASKYTNAQFPHRASQVGVVRSSGLLRGTPYQVETAGRSLSIRAKTPGVDPMRPFEQEEDKVEEGLIATRDLLAWIRANAAEIARLLEHH